MQFERYLTQTLTKYITKNKNILLLGPRQTGKSTLVENILKNTKTQTLTYKLQDIRVYEEIIRSPGSVLQLAETMLENKKIILFIDEIQKIPTLLDGCQYLIDKYKKNITVIITGSSARKLRRQGVNLLPGRIIVENLYPLTLPEIIKQDSQKIIPFSMPDSKNTHFELNDFLRYGTLPGVLTDTDFQEKILRSYVSTYLQEEIRQEALTRNLGAFSKFLELAAFYSGQLINLTNISQDTGIPIPTVKNYFNLLEDTLVTFTLPSFTHKTKKQILNTPKYFFFDVGIRNACCGIFPDKNSIRTEFGGRLFEQFIILELIKRIKYSYPSWKYFFFRTKNGIEVDFIIQTEDEIIPIEIKYVDVPHEKHIKHLEIFIDEFKCRKGFLIGNFKHYHKLKENIYAVPWNKI